MNKAGPELNVEHRTPGHREASLVQSSMLAGGDLGDCIFANRKHSYA